MATGDPSAPGSNVVLHPLTSLSLQPSAIGPGHVTMGSLGEHDNTGAWWSRLLPGTLHFCSYTNMITQEN
jgi:hypothetical protein